MTTSSSEFAICQIAFRHRFDLLFELIGLTMYTRIYLFLALIVALYAGSALADGHTADYIVLDIEDGDTLLLEIEGQSVRAQLLGIDAPEDADNPKFRLDLKNTEMDAEQLKQLGMAATLHLKSLIAIGESVTMQGALREKDRYGRIPVIIDNMAGRTLSEAMVQDGYAIALPPTEQDYAYGRRLDRLERFSRKSSNGLWGSHPDTFRNWYDRTR